MPPKNAQIKVAVKSGMFHSERSVSFSAGNVHYTLVVDEHDLTANDRLRVLLLNLEGDDALVELPRETFTSGARVRIPRSLLVDDDSLRPRYSQGAR